MLNGILPTAAFTAATTSPAMLGSALDILDFAGRHMMWLGGGLTAFCLVLVVWSNAREASRQEAIQAADDEWSATGQPVKGWGPGWVWSGWTPEATAEQELAAAEDALVADEPIDVRPINPAAALRSPMCCSCHTALATTTVLYRDGERFRVCDGCAPAGVKLDSHVPTSFGRSA